MVERTQIDKIIEEQGFQRSNMTQTQLVRLGQLLNVSKIVVGDINVVMNQYNVDARVINVETGTISATEGATFATSSYRSSMQSVATKLASKIAITTGGTVQASTPNSSAPTTLKSRNKVEILYGYLKIFPNELGVFQSEPTTVIAQINKQTQHGYNNWRIPTNEELSLLRANNYLGSGTYMSRENRNGIVLLVTDGDDYVTVQAAEQERIKAEQERQAREEAERLAKEEERKAWLQEHGLVDLGLPSGTLWKSENEPGLYKRSECVTKNLPTEKQFDELKNKCVWNWIGNGYNIIGPNGNFIFLSAQGYKDNYIDYKYHGQSSIGYYWTFEEKEHRVYYSNGGWYLAEQVFVIESSKCYLNSTYCSNQCSVRYVYNP
ncbi:MAG: hypothetical protein IKQ09_03010 [Bacteroidales bacterium]|nr:hypothetical protein [Bacteroidales bacterium]